MAQNYKGNPEYNITKGKGRELSRYEAQKIIDGIDKETEQQQFWKILPWALLLAFAFFTICLMMSGAL